MRISTEWLPKGPNAAAEEAATVARIRIAIGKQNATDMRIERENQIVNHVIAPAYPLAEAISYRWWTLIYGRGRGTRLRSMRGGFAIPDISIKVNGNGRIDVACEPFIYENPPVEFVSKAWESVPVHTFENDVRDFIANVVQRLLEEKVEATPLANRWSRIIETLGNAQEKDFCQAAGALGVDPYTCTEDTASFIGAAATIFDGDELEEFLAGVRPESGMSAIGWVRQAEQQPDDSWCLLPAIEDCRKDLAFRKTAGAPWTAGYASARRVRRHLQISESEPVTDLSALATRLGNNRFRATEPSNTGLRGVSHLLRGRPRAIVGGSRHPAALLFAVARTFGDAIHFGSSKPSPITDQIGTYRQALARAFAAEFLAPLTPILEMHSKGDPIEEIAETFGVSEMVIHHQIENKQNNLSA